jgi:hypothetical protein
MMKVTNTPRNKRTSKGMTAVTHTKLARKELPICLRVLATIKRIVCMQSVRTDSQCWPIRHCAELQ